MTTEGLRFYLRNKEKILQRYFKDLKEYKHVLFSPWESKGGHSTGWLMVSLTILVIWPQLDSNRSHHTLISHQVNHVWTTARVVPMEVSNFPGLCGHGVIGKCQRVQNSLLWVQIGVYLCLCRGFYCPYQASWLSAWNHVLLVLCHPQVIFSCHPLLSVHQIPLSLSTYILYIRKRNHICAVFPWSSFMFFPFPPPG